MTDIKISVSDDIKSLIKSRAEELKLNNSEYIRMLVNLDCSIQRYQKLATYINVMYNKINEYHQELGIYATPLQVAPLIQITND